MSDLIPEKATSEQVQRDLERAGYLANDELATVCLLAFKLCRPIFCEGEAGVGKTSLATALATAYGLPLFRLQCYEGLDASQALYDWDFRKQLLYLRAAQALGDAHEPAQNALEGALYDRRFLLTRAVLNAFEASPSVLLIDEIDRADDEFEAFLLEALADFSITIPELGTIKAKVPPIVIVTSNRTREVHDALKRRCLYHWLEHPSRELEAAILRRKLDGLSVGLCDQITNATQRLRSANLLKAPGMAESLDWAAALMALDVRELDRTTVSRTIGALLKYREDQDQVRRDDFSVFLSSSPA